MLKKLTAALLCASMLCIPLCGIEAQSEYANDFDTDVFEWTRGYSGNSNYMKMQNSASGYTGAAKEIVYDHSEDTYSTYVSAALPSAWDMSGFSEGGYIHFLAKGTSAAAHPSAMYIELLSSDNTSLAKYAFCVEDNDWEHIIIPVNTDISSLSVFKLTDNMKGSAGSFLIDDFSVSAQKPQRKIEHSPNQCADFETAQTTLSSAAVYAGFKNSAGDYSDFIKAQTALGMDGNGLEISYRAATWYSGEIFLNAPAVWDVNKDVNALEFDYKGSGSLKAKLMCGKVVGGDRYETAITLTDDGEWHHVILPLTDFKKSGVSVTKEEILGMAFTAAQNGGLNNTALETLALSARELEAKAKTGTAVLDNIALTDNYTEAPPTPSPTPEPTPKPASSYTIDFDNVKLYPKGTWAGFKNNSGDYSDYIKGAMSEGGKDKSGFLLEYQSATYYAGEVFTQPIPAFDTSVNVNYVEFDIKGRAIFKMALETGAVINGTRYECRFEADTGGEWRHLCLPVTAFSKNGQTVPMSEVVGISFTAAENGNLSNSSDEVKAMSADELKAKAKTGSIMIDNLTFSEESENKTGISADTCLYQNGAPIPSAKQAADGKVTVVTTLSNCVVTQPVTAFAAVYDKSGALVSVGAASGKIMTEGGIECSVNIKNAADKTMRLFLFESTDTMRPIAGDIDL
ncbi:MAG: hypothetical protein PUF72_08160 [Clostridiales bacterium]|nr:hypothetical protein [Clostridiales bacterium]